MPDNGIDDVGQELVELHFVYRDEWAVSQLFRCGRGHLALRQGRGPGSTSMSGGTCSRADHGSPYCGLPMELYVPSDEGITALEWAKCLLKRRSDQRQAMAAKIIRLENVIRSMEGDRHEEEATTALR